MLSLVLQSPQSPKKALIINSQHGSWILRVPSVVKDLKKKKGKRICWCMCTVPPSAALHVCSTCCSPKTWLLLTSFPFYLSAAFSLTSSLQQHILLTHLIQLSVSSSESLEMVRGRCLSKLSLTHEEVRVSSASIKLAITSAIRPEPSTTTQGILLLMATWID